MDILNLSIDYKLMGFVYVLIFVLSLVLIKGLFAIFNFISMKVKEDE